MSAGSQGLTWGGGGGASSLLAESLGADGSVIRVPWGPPGMQEELEQGHSSQENVAPFKFYWTPFSLEVALEGCSVDLLPTLPSSVQVPKGK